MSSTRDWWLKSPNEIRVRIGGFAIREICHSQHVTPPVSRIRSREWRASRSWFLTSKIVCDWLTDNRLMGHESTVQHMNRIPRVPSDESQLMGGYGLHTVQHLETVAGKLLINALHRYVYVTRFSIVNVPKDPVKTSTITSKTGVKQLCLLQIESSICHGMSCKHFVHTFITYDFIMITSVTYGTILTVWHIEVSKFIHIYRHTPGLDSVMTMAITEIVRWLLFCSGV